MSGLLERFGVSPTVTAPSITPRSAMLDERGATPPGALFLLVDGALGMPAAARLARSGLHLVTSHLHLDLATSVIADETLSCAAEDPVLDGRSAFGCGAVTGTNGRRVATATARYAVLPQVARRDPARPLRRPTRPGAPPTALDHAADQASIDADASSPIDLTLRLAWDPTSRTMRFSADPELANERSTLHGGIIGLVGERALRSAALHEARVEMVTPVELRAIFLRPVPALGQRVDYRVSFEHVGRTTLVGTARLDDEAGRTCAFVSGVLLVG